MTITGFSQLQFKPNKSYYKLPYESQLSCHQQLWSVLVEEWISRPEAQGSGMQSRDAQVRRVTQSLSSGYGLIDRSIAIDVFGK